MFPQLEEIIHLRRNRRTGLEENGCVSEREDQLKKLCSDFLLSDKKCQYVFTYDEVRHIKQISDIVEAEGIDFRLVSKNWFAIQEILAELGRTRMLEFTQSFQRIISGALAACGVPSFTQDPVSIRDKIEIPAILDNPCAFFFDSDEHVRCSTFVDAASNLLGLALSSFETFDDFEAETMAHRIERIYQTDSWSPDWDAIRVAKALLEDMDVSEETTMRDLLSRECSFVCMRCNSFMRTAMPWPSLVCKRAFLLKNCRN